ncbi:5'-AMP-activated protein kinase beta subunit, interation domain family protein [Clavispora lusitaniae]|uniref:Association with the SNF1 complex (ASC) domain-containing protein n=1 Tax=Clavispora lusitaniae (strain ATCC 42720) TaxID=306902 RepID=C4Y9B1_CLAL4|nr:uncharacterized protein CLUG_04789 [Clavispora lusitaniae ATCC 42720]EEQ40661.1 hypothetical protein CLUG_04789 [Clavispora lusitaniae ATCC 42720]KAF5209419.1 hypothetical protein E0198_003719 [Clavispora lusitaniae]KAF7581427.1 5'-AMP-activated protein kinase beta subunit, interation domain family protein [Clavispora lusitaniae]
MSDQNDISMVDVSNALDSIESETAPPRRKSTLILTDEVDSLTGSNSQVSESSQHQAQPSVQTASNAQNAPAAQNTHNSQSAQDAKNTQNTQNEQNMPNPPPEAAIPVPVDIKWVQGGQKVYVTGSFTGWRKMIGLQQQPDDKSFMVTLGLPVGTHRFRFVVDNELRFSDFLPTATDQMGNFVNYIEVTPEHVQMHLKHQKELEDEQHQLEEQEKQRSQAQSRTRSPSINRGRSDSIFGFINDDDDMGNGYSRYHDGDVDTVPSRSLNYISDIPPIFVDPKVMEQYYLAIDEQAKQKNAPQQAWLHPPQLPPHLENVILNNYNTQDKDNNSGALPIPNHVVLNHLATTSIKHNTLAVASIVRYKRKYVTQVLYAPLQS